MTKGVREFTNELFINILPQLAELGNAGFRRKIIAQTVMAFDCTVASAATHYNHALKMVRASNPDAIKGLGRPEDKKGGRKPIHTVDVIKTKTGEVIAAGVSKSVAESLIAKAAAAHKAKLEIKVVVIETPPEVTVNVEPTVAAVVEEAGPTEAAI